MMNEEDDNPSWSSFLIDLDLSIKERQDNSAEESKTGTRAFMAIGALNGEKHTTMHDLESFFWVLFWVCIHYTGPGGEDRVLAEFDHWNVEHTNVLATLKSKTVGDEKSFIKTITENFTPKTVGDEKSFIKTITENFTPYYQPLIPWVTKLRRVVFSEDGRLGMKDVKLYSQMREVLQEAKEDPEVLGRVDG
jgi:hypothetical protein